MLIATGVGKGLDLPGFVRVIDSYDLMPAFSYWPIAIGMTSFELFLGTWLLSNRRIDRAALASVALHLAFIGWSVIALLRGLNLSNCGCFGVFLARPLTWATPVEDLVIVAVSLAIYALAPKRAR